MHILKQSTAVDVLIGPFVDSDDGYTAETGLSPSVKLSKNGQALAAKNDATTPVHDADGYYNCELDATDTNTVGTLVLSVVGDATSLPVRHEFQVVEEAIYDSLFAASAAAFDANQRVDVGSWIGNAVTASSGNPDVNVESIDNIDAPATWKASINSECDTALTDYDAVVPADLNDPTAAAIADAVWDEASTGHVDAGKAGAQLWTDIDAILVDTGTTLDGKIDTIDSNVDAILVDTNELQGDWTNGGRLDLIIDAILVDTGTTLDGKVDTIDTNVDAILADTGTDGVKLAASQVVVKKNTALSNFMFLMTDDTNHDPSTGLTVTATRSIDGAAFAACANAVSEVANGMYKINLAAADLNGDVITLRFTAASSDDTLVTILTQ